MESLTVDKTGLVQPAKNGNTFKLDNGLAVNATNLGYNTEIYIAFRTDNKPGSGTRLDPYDGSTTAKFDAVMRGLGTYKTVHIGNGTFTTTGSSGYNSTNGYLIPPGTKIFLSPKTVIQLAYYPVAAAGNGHPIWESDIYTDGDGIEIRGKGTFDCNWNGLKSVLTPTGSDYNAKVGAVSLHGNNCKIVGPRCINAYGNLHFLVETFPLRIGPHTSGGSYQACSGAEISDTDSDLFQGDYGVALTVSNTDDGTTGSMSGSVFNNRIYNWNGTSAIGAAGNGKQIYGNYIKGGKVGMYVDTYHSFNLNIHHNIILDQEVWGIHLAPSLGSAEVRNVKITDNIIEVNRTHNSTASAISIDGHNNTYNVEIARNLILRGSAGSFSTQVGIAVSLSDGVIVDSNIVDSAMQNDLHNTVGDAYPNTHLTVRANLTNLGTSPPGLQSSVLPSALDSQVSGASGSIRFVATFATNGYALYTLPVSASYTIVSGDKLIYEIIGDDSNPVYRPAGYFQFSDATNSGQAVDQYGIPSSTDVFASPPTVSDIAARAKGHWQTRIFDLTAFAGKITSIFWFGDAQTYAPAGQYGWNWRNIRILGADGTLKRTIYQEGVTTTEPTYLFSGGATNYSCTGNNINPLNIRSLPGTVVNGQFVFDGAHAYIGIGGAWVQVDAASGVGGTAGYQAATVSTAGNTASTQATPVHSIKVTASAGAGAYVRTISLPTAGRAAGDIAKVHIDFAASVNPTLEIHNATSGGTLLWSWTGDGTASAAFIECVFDGAAWYTEKTGFIQ